MRVQEIQHARGWNSAEYCTDCINTTLPEMRLDYVFSKNSCRMAGCAAHKSGGCRVVVVRPRAWLVSVFRLELYSRMESIGMTVMSSDELGKRRDALRHVASCRSQHRR